MNIARVGLEAGPLLQWLFEGLPSAGLPAISLTSGELIGVDSAQAHVHFAVIFVCCWCETVVPAWTQYRPARTRNIQFSRLT